MNVEGKRIKVLFAIGRMSVGGAEKLLVYQLRTLSSAFDPRVITLFPEQKDSLANDVRIDKCFRFRSAFDIFALAHLYLYLRRERFDAVVTSLFSANLLVRITAILARVPVIISYEHNIYPQKHRWQIFMDRFLARFTDLIITDSEAARVFTARQERIPLEKFKTMYISPLLEGTPKDARTVRRELGVPENATVVLTVSRLIGDKGHRYLIDAAREVLSAQKNVYFVIVGWGPEGGPLKEQIARYGVGDKVKLPGRMDIRDVLPISDIYVDPAVSTDLPIAVMEAMREKRAIVATNIAEIPVFIEHNVTGLLVEPKDVSGLSRALTTLLSDATLRTRLGEAASRRVEKFSLKEYMREFEKLIVDLYDARAKN